MKTVDVPVSKIKPYERNAKKHPKDQVKRIAKSIEEFGFVQPLVIDNNNVLVIGHGRLEAAKTLGIDKVPCVRASELTDEQIAALRLIDNKVAESAWDKNMLNLELQEISFDFEDFGFDLDFDLTNDEEEEDYRDPSCQHNVFENQERMQFPIENYYGIPVLEPTQTVGDKWLRFMDHKEEENLGDYIAHFYYDDYKFMAAWRDPDKYIDKLRQFKAVVTPNFSTYTDFPKVLQILACYRSNWCGKYWQYHGIDVIPDVCWGDRESWDFCFMGIPEGGTVAISSVSVANDPLFNGKEDTLFLDGYNEMMKRIKPKTVLYYGSMLPGVEGPIINIPSYYAEKREMLNEMARIKREKEKNGV